VVVEPHSLLQLTTHMAGTKSLLSWLSIVVVFASAYQVTAAGVCSLYTSCISCACSTFDYEVSDTCHTGCAWIPSSGVCVEASSSLANSTTNSITSLWTSSGVQLLSDSGLTDSQKQSLRDRFVESGATTCSIAYGGGTVPTVVIMCCITFLLEAILVYSYVRSRSQNRMPQQAGGWLPDAVRQHVPEGDRVLWQGTATAPTCADESSLPRAIAALMMFVPMMTPTIVWLGIGLPLEVDVSWEFGFFYPIYFVGSFGLVGSSILLSSYIKRKVMLKTYVVTNRHVMIVTANLTRGDLNGAAAGVKSHGFHAVGFVERTGNKIKFSTIQFVNSANITSVISFDKLATADANTVFVLLQQLHPEHPVPVGAEEPSGPKDDGAAPPTCSVSEQPNSEPLVPTSSVPYVGGVSLV